MINSAGISMIYVHKRRIEACTYIWSILVKNRLRARAKVVELLKRTYRQYNIEPIRGRTKINIFDKEMATLFLVGKYGLGLKEYHEIFEEVFEKEIRSEYAIDSILSNGNPEKVLKEIMGSTDENAVFRVIRLLFTATLLGFRDEKELILILEKFEQSFPQYRKRFLSFKKFYIAFRIAESIAAGVVRNRLEKEALKHALCIKLNAMKAAPPDNLIREIALNVLKANEIEVNDALRKNSIELRL